VSGSTGRRRRLRAPSPFVIKHKKHLDLKYGHDLRVRSIVIQKEQNTVTKSTEIMKAVGAIAISIAVIVVGAREISIAVIVVGAIAISFAVIVVGAIAISVAVSW
jgi:predicted phage tail protein